MRKLLSLPTILMSLILVAASLTLGLHRLSASSTSSKAPVATLVAAISQVYYQGREQPTSLVIQATPLGVSQGDAVNVDTGGQAQLKYPDGLSISVFRETQLKLEATIDPNASSIDNFTLNAGTIFSISPQDRVRQRMHIDTGWAIIEDVGTQFLTYRNPLTDLTWVVVTQGQVKVTEKTSGRNVLVPAGWQTWLGPQQPLRDPVPATRFVVDRLLQQDTPPVIEDLTNASLHDQVILSNPQCEVSASDSTLLKVVKTPELYASDQIVDRLQNGARFEAMGRMDVHGTTWIAGVAANHPSLPQGWIPAKSLTCGYDIALLPTIHLTIPIITPTSTPTVIPSATPTTTSSSTPSPTPCQNMLPPMDDATSNEENGTLEHLEAACYTWTGIWDPHRGLLCQVDIVSIGLKWVPCWRINVPDNPPPTATPEPPTYTPEPPTQVVPISVRMSRQGCNLMEINALGFSSFEQVNITLTGPRNSYQASSNADASGYINAVQLGNIPSWGRSQCLPPGVYTAYLQGTSSRRQGKGEFIISDVGYAY